MCEAYRAILRAVIESHVQFYFVPQTKAHVERSWFTGLTSTSFPVTGLRIESSIPGHQQSILNMGHPFRAKRGQLGAEGAQSY